ncbi:MAG: hypothetical protein LGB69_07835, partial [Sulfurovum sp.]|nr:hypothetical protein [Sulfurovum sp.]
MLKISILKMPFYLLLFVDSLASQLDEDVWDTAYGGEVSEHERQGVKERLRKEITTHVSIHTLHLDGLRDLHRHFLRLPDGAV